MMDFFERFDEAKYGTDGGPLHDPNVIAWLIRPEIYAGREVNVEVETGSELTMGQTVIDWWGATDRPRTPPSSARSTTTRSSRCCWSGSGGCRAANATEPELRRQAR